MAWQNTIVNSLSFDIEDWFQPEVFFDIYPRDTWNDMESRVEAQTDSILGELGRCGVKATFFLLGWVAERHPALVRRIVAGGHELACHGYGHTMITRQDRVSFEEDLRRARGVIEELAGVRVLGYRAATFSITEKTKWALEALWENGFFFDSSIYPIHHDRYGIPSAPRFPFIAVEKEGRALWEVPGPTMRIGRVTLPAAGGGYLRLFPYLFTREAIRRANRSGYPVNVFAHPWEFDNELPKVKLPLVSRVRHYGGIGRNRRKLRRLIEEFHFAPMGDVVDKLQREKNQTTEVAK